MPRLARIIVFPIKSFDGIEVASSDFTPCGGLRNDRRFAFLDVAGKQINGKRFPAIHALRSTFADDLSTVTFAGNRFERETFRLAGGNADLERRMSDYLGVPVRLEENGEQGFYDDLDSPGPTILSVATLAAVTSWFPELDVVETRRRFRANLEVDGSNGDPCPAFWEDRLFAADAAPGARDAVPFRIGAVELHGVNPCARCPVPTRDSQTGEVYERFAVKFQEHRRESLPPWAPPTAFDHFYRLSVNTRPSPTFTGGTIRVGDEVVVV